MCILNRTKQLKVFYKSKDFTTQEKAQFIIFLVQSANKYTW